MLAVLLGFVAGHATASADEDWVIRSFNASISVNTDGSVEVSEDIQVDFGQLERHGILRDIPVEYEYDAESKRRVTVSVTGVDDGERPLGYEVLSEGANLAVRIGDPDVLVSGEQHYRLHYRVEGALNPQAGWDELYWNVTGNDWEVPIQATSASVAAPSILTVACYQGTRGAVRPCEASGGSTSAEFKATVPLAAGDGLTIVVALTKGSVAVPPLDLVEVKSGREQVSDFVGLGPLPVGLAIGLGIACLALLGRYWWLGGRDRWFGDVHYLTGATESRPRPLFARDTVVVEYQPPMLEQTRRRLRPAEIGTLLDERADTLDVSATIVDLAVRGYLRITEIEKTWLFGKVDYQLDKLKASDADLLHYERTLLEALFEDGDSVTMSDLRNEFYTDLARVKTALYDQVTKDDRFFPKSPDAVREGHLIGGLVIAGLGAVAFFALGGLLGAAIIGVPVVATGLLMIVFTGAMPRRTAPGREMFRRCLGFREYMVVAETDRQRFAEEAGLFERYLPFAIIYGCVEKWARAFEGIGGAEPTTSGWYVATHPFTPLAFSQSLQGFSSSVSSAIASTPGGSGGSGFSGGGFSGGGVGGGGGSSW